MQLSLIEDPRPVIQELLSRVAEAENMFLKFLSANDLGLTDSHQAGVYISRESWSLFDNQEGEPGENRNRNIALHRDNGPPVAASFKWYGGKSRNEYRLTKTRELFRNREEIYLGALFLVLLDRGRYFVHVLSHEEDIDAVLNFLGIGPAEVGSLRRFDLEERARPIFEAYLEKSGPDFPGGEELARLAQGTFEEIYPAKRKDPAGELNPDQDILTLINLEFNLYRFIERRHYGYLLEKKFESIEDLIAVSLAVNNRRKSRAGRSLEYHLRYIFDVQRIPYSFNEVTEGSKKPDFIFPGIEAYRNPSYAPERLFFLGAKTTCKDRWRQIINEADRVPCKHLFTLQQGFTSAQLREMQEANVIPVLPRSYHQYCKKSDQHLLLGLNDFISIIKKLPDRQLSLF